MIILSNLRDYIVQEIGDLVTVTYKVYGDGTRQDRITITHKGRLTCSIYKNKNNEDLFDVVFYGPFTCKSAGYSPIVNLTLSEIPRAIKNRIDICDSVNKIDVNVNVSNDVITKEICMMTARGSGKTRWITDLLKKLNINIKRNIKDVIFNDPATIVLWTDGSKTVVKCQKGETFDPEKGLAMAISKKVLGNGYDYYEVFNKYVGRYNKKRFNKALEEAKKIPPDEITYNGETYVLKNKEE